MKYYKQYMSRQEISAEAHQRLLSLEVPQKKASRRWLGAAALAACCALILGVRLWQMNGTKPAPAPVPSFRVEAEGTGEGAFLPAEKGEEDAPAQEGGQLMFPMIPYINYRSVDTSMDLAASIALMEGSFDVDLTREDILTLFWGEEGQEKLPWTLFWDEYDLSGRIIYDGGGNLFWLMLFGEHPEGHSFELELSHNRLPPTCLGEPDTEGSEVFGTSVTGWSRAYDRNGDGITDYICGAEFMAGDLGVRFENAGSPFADAAEDTPETLMNAAAQFNALFVRQALVEDGGLHAGHLLHTDDIPQWREAEFETLAQARREADYAPFLPVEEPGDFDEFYGRLTWQEGLESTLFVRWSREREEVYEQVEVCVFLPEGKHNWFPPVDVTVPESYDTRLYTVPWYDSVPEEYQENFYMAHFHAQDMSLAVVEARGTQNDEGGLTYRFGVLHPDGTMVQYTCSGLTARQVWDMVEPSLGR